MGTCQEPSASFPVSGSIPKRLLLRLSVNACGLEPLSCPLQMGQGLVQNKQAELFSKNRLANGQSICITPLTAATERLFPGSSAVEHSTVNRQVAGSNPARGAILF